MDIEEKLDKVIAELRAARAELEALNKSLDVDAEDRLQRAVEFRRALAANARTYRNTPRVVYDRNNDGKAMVYSGKERIL